MNGCRPPAGGKSEMLRATEVRDAYRLIGECRDLGGDATAWCVRALEGLRKLVGAPHGSGGEGWPPEPGRPIEALSIIPSGMDAAELEKVAAFARARDVTGDPLFTKFRYACGRALTRTRPQVVADDEYHPSLVYQKYLRGGVFEHRLASVHQRSAAVPFTVIHLSRPRGERDFSARERRLLNFFHQELGPLVGRALVSIAEPSPEHLAPRLRQTLACLLEGDSEKQVAARLGVSTTTTHQYVTALYRRLGVRSRGQLMALAFKRSRHPAWVHFPSRG